MFQEDSALKPISVDEGELRCVPVLILLQIADPVQHRRAPGCGDPDRFDGLRSRWLRPGRSPHGEDSCQ